MFEIKAQKTVCEIPPQKGNGRNSEGDFITLKDGTIMFAYSRYNSDGGEDDDSCDIAALYSYDNGESFTDMRILVKAEDLGVKNLMCVSLMRMQNGDIGLFFLKKLENGFSEYYLLRSDDEGKSFYSQKKCFPDTYKSYYVVNNARVLRTSDSRLFVPAASHRTGFDEKNELQFDYYAFSLLFCSEDDGNTWKEINVKFANPNPNSETGLQEPGITELKNGSLYTYFRTDCLCQYESISVDGGKTWTTPSPSIFTSPESPMLIRKNPYSGKYYSIYNPVPFYNTRNEDEDFFQAGRTPIILRESNDGINFSNEIILENDENKGYCYPAVHFIDEKTLLISFCAGGKEDGSCLNKTVIKKILL